MKFMQLLCAIIGALACGGMAQAGELAYTVRATELKTKPYSDAKTLFEIAEQSQVEIVTRQGSWDQVRFKGKTGWVKMLSLRLNASGQQQAGDSGFKALFNVAATGSSGSTTTTGVRGLSEEKLKNPHPDPQALEELHSYTLSQTAAQKFAKAGKLVATRMDYLPAPTSGGKRDE